MTRRIVRFPLQLLALMLFMSAVALAQTDDAQPCTPEQAVPNEVRAITEALSLCETVGTITSSHTNLSSKSFVQDQSLVQAAQITQAQITMASLQLTSASAELDKVVLKRTGRTMTGQGRLALASAVIGIIGGGVGGTLHLVNNPQVGHAATVVGISAGVVGGSIGAVSAFVYGRVPPLDHNEKVGLLIRRYAKAKEGSSLQDSIIETNPERFSVLIQSMSDDLQVLQRRLIE